MLVLVSPSVTDPDKARVIRAYRSLFYLYYKLEVPFTPEQLDVALEAWKSNELELAEFCFPDYYDKDLTDVREILASVNCDESCFTQIVPRHGPGAVAGGEDSEGKWASAHYIPTLHRVYPRYDYYFGFRSRGRISSDMCGEILAFVKRSEVREAVSKLIFVPKDSRGPRTISCEPKELMFLQQGVARNLMVLYHSLTHGRINFIDQTVNGSLARTSSLSGEFATVDLKDASDRVSLKLVDLLFPDWALKYLHALRSHSTKLPDGTLFERHAKYAPMGSALCFPIESVVFWSIAVVAGINSGLTEREARVSTYVYGDDIIIRPCVFQEFLRLASKFALKVNVDKSYIEGPFRESCGVDAWKGYNVTPFRIKKDICGRSLGGPLAAAICEYASTCFGNNYTKTGNYLHKYVSSVYPGIPVVRHGDLPCLHVVNPLTDLDLKDQVRYGYSLEACRCWVTGWVLSDPKKPVTLTGLSRLLRAYYGDWEVHDPSQVVVPRATKIRKRKVLVEWGKN
jgi:hypothetical protein